MGWRGPLPVIGQICWSWKAGRAGEDVRAEGRRPLLGLTAQSVRVAIVTADRADTLVCPFRKQAAVLHGFGNVFAAQGIAVSKIRQRPGNLEDAVIGAS